MLLVPRNYDGLKNVTAIHLLIDLDLLIHGKGVLALDQTPKKTITDYGFSQC